MSRSVLITGASSGIGEGLAREFARRGWRLALLARRAAQLEERSEELRTLGAPAVVVQALDVRDTPAIAPALTACWGHLGGLDVVIANAGVGYNFRTGEGRIELMREMIEVDLTGACATIDAAVGLFRKRGGGGHVVGITSVARYRGLSQLGVYSACKEGLHRYLEAVRMECEPEAITVTELAPGYIDTPMNRGTRSRPFVIDVERGARIMADLIEREVSYATVPQWPWRVLGRVMQLLPASALRAML
jgi:NAD(P)-dependent dehydrogenase (short-subunit alcohol dehydrogenase family)